MHKEQYANYDLWKFKTSSSCRYISSFRPRTHYMRVSIFYQLQPYRRFDYFYSRHPVPTPNARYELDRRRRPRLRSHISRMIAVESRREWLTEHPWGFSFSFSFALCYLPLENMWCSVCLAPLRALAFYSEAEAVDRPFPCFSSFSIFTLSWPGRGTHRHAFRSIRRTSPVDRSRTVAHSHGLPLLGSSSKLLEAPRQHACTRNACVRARESRLPRRTRLLHIPVYNKLATRAKIMPSYWKWNSTRRATAKRENLELRFLMDPGNCLGE